MVIEVKSRRNNLNSFDTQLIGYNKNPKKDTNI